MGFIRGGLLVVVSVLFLVSLLAMNSLLIASLSLDYDNIQKEVIPVVKESLKEKINLAQVVENNQFSLLQNFCANISNNADYIFNEQGYTFVVPCSVVSKGAQEMLNVAIDKFVYDTYYKEYNCTFFDCFKEGEIPFFIVSQHSKDYWQGKFYISLLISFILFALMFLLVEKKSNFSIVAGSLIILSSLLFAKLETFARWLINKLSSVSLAGSDDIFKFFTLIFIQSYKVFLIMLIIGLALVVFGIILKFFAVGFKINEFFSKFGRTSEAK